MALDLTGLQPMLTDLVLVDRCDIDRDPEGTDDDVLDPDSLSFELPEDAETVETDVAFIFRAEGRLPQLAEAGAPSVVADYVLSFPITDPQLVKVGDLIRPTYSLHNPGYVTAGVVFRVFELVEAGFAMFQQVRARARTQTVEQP
jgi:hypothetical protein